MATSKKKTRTTASKASKATKKASKAKKPKAKAEATPLPRTYSTVLRHLLGRTNYERVRVVNYDEKTFKLDRMRKLLKKMGNPHESLRMIHVAGTVGKGSTTGMLANMLEQCGFTVGTFTSPHLVKVTERIAINGEQISESAFTSLMRDVIQAADATEKSTTFFELLTAAAVKYFADEAVDLAIIEVGLGGRLDSTNVITPELSLLTTIDLDHTRILGSTIEEIALEKAGIMKPGVPCISVPQDPAIATVLREHAESIECPLQIIGEDIEFSSRFCVSDDLGPHTRICLVTDRNQYMHLPVPLQGEHQGTNCAVALAAVSELQKKETCIQDGAMFRGLSSTKIPGRMELVWKQPRILIDGAHNPIALATLMRSIGAHVPYDSMICIFGCCEDKDVDTMLDNLAIGGDKIIFTAAAGQPRAVEPDELRRRFMERRGRSCQVAENIGEALEIAARAASRDDLICVTGSFYLIGETKEHLTKLEARRKVTS
ncbi:MAG: bifunctional folylpolyglutamate synthase/dihydrofolate synthase [Phycisphaerales bacterium]|nr:bifunctional folylpolyglutamate synthase/dihydrofolate synthase [Phycisphaerales bacterium]